MTIPPSKRPAKAAPAQPEAHDREPAAREAVVLTPVSKKIGEPAGNLKARSEAFRRRHLGAK